MPNTSQNSDELTYYIGRKIRERRKIVALTQKELADKLGVSHQQFQKYEEGLTRIPVTCMYALTKLLGVTVEYFFAGFQQNNNAIEYGTIPIMRTNALHILLIEDNIADVIAIKKALESHTIETMLSTVHDGAKALAFLRKKKPRPDIILLDLNIPKIKGDIVLKTIKWDRTLQDIPVIILTNNLSALKMIELYKLHANGYICKSFDLSIFIKHIQQLVEYWSAVVALPGMTALVDNESREFS